MVNFEQSITVVLPLHLHDEGLSQGMGPVDSMAQSLMGNQLAGVPQKFHCHLHTGHCINAVTVYCLARQRDPPGPG